jgi:ribosomal protein S18 acetylase RimI-like enzyme
MKKLRSKEVEIRKAQMVDLPALVQMWNEFSREHEQLVARKTKAFASFYKRTEDALDRTERFFRKNIMARNAAVLIAEAGGVAAGYLIVSIKKNPPVYKIDRMGYIDSLFIRKSFRGAGISSRFKEIAVDWFRKKGLAYMSLNVAPQNAHAHSIYRGWGFDEHQIEMRMKIG